MRRGLALEVSLALVRDALGFAPLAEAVGQVRDDVGKGQALSDALRDSFFFPPTFILFVKGAEKHGELPDTLVRMAESFEERGDVLGTRLRFFVFLFSQILAGCLVLFALAALFLPIFDMTYWY